MAFYDWWHQYVSENLSLGLAVAGAVAYIIENARRRRAERRLDVITRRGRAPYLYADCLYIAGHNSGFDPVTGGYEPGYEPVHRGQVLSPMLKDSVSVRVTLTNQGEHVREVRFESTDGLMLTADRAELKHGENTASIEYIYTKQRRGEAMPFTIHFCTKDGLKLSQTYTLVHGECRVTRTDPP